MLVGLSAALVHVAMVGHDIDHSCDYLNQPFSARAGFVEDTFLHKR
jgi:hypothetical protein